MRRIKRILFAALLALMWNLCHIETVQAFNINSEQCSSKGQKRAESWENAAYERVMLQFEKMLGKRVDARETAAQKMRWDTLMEGYQDRLAGLASRGIQEAENRRQGDEYLQSQMRGLGEDWETFRGEEPEALSAVLEQLWEMEGALGVGDSDGEGPQDTEDSSYTKRLTYLYSLLDNARIYADEEGKLWAVGRDGFLPGAEVGYCTMYLDDTMGILAPIRVSVARRGQEDYRVEVMDGGEIPTPQKEGWSFAGWQDERGNSLQPEYVEQGKIWHATWVDDIGPSLQIQVGRDDSTYVDVTLEAQDPGTGTEGVYLGNEDPQAEIVDFREGNCADYRLENSGHYHAAALDGAGNITCREFQVYEIRLQGRDAILATDLAEKNLPEMTRTGYDFLGWIPATEEAAPGDGDSDGGESASQPVKTILAERNMELVPCFEACKYEVTFHANGGACDVESIRATYGKPLGELPTPQRTGYLFQGWELDVTGENPASQTEENGKVTVSEDYVLNVAGDIVLTARWTPITYSVRFDPNSDATGEMEIMALHYDEEMPLPRNRFLRTGYVFMGWSTDSGAISTQNSVTARDRSFNGAQWLNEESVCNLTDRDGEEVCLYAVWQEIAPGVMDYRYCMGSYQYFACVTTHYVTDYSGNEGALFVAMTPSGAGGYAFGANAVWATSSIRQQLNSGEQTDLLGIKLTDTTVNRSYSGMFYNYSPSQQAPCTRADMGLNTPMAASAVAAETTLDYLFIPEMGDCYRYMAGAPWNWFWDMNLDGVPDTYPISGLNSGGFDSAVYYPSIQAASDAWARLGWGSRVWLRNQYTGYPSYPIYVAQYGIGPCNPANGAFAGYRTCCSYGYLVRAMYTRAL